MAHSQAALSIPGHVPSGQGHVGNRQIPKRPYDKAAASRPMALVAVSEANGGDANGHSSMAKGVIDRQSKWSESEVEYIVSNWLTLSTDEMSRHLGRTQAAIRFKGVKLGLKREKPILSPFRKKPVVVKPKQTYNLRLSSGYHERAADFLRIHDRTPVYRCASDGRANPSGDHWRYGNAVLTDDEVAAKAKRKGWDEHEWRRIA